MIATLSATSPADTKWRSALGPLGFGGAGIGNLYASVSEEDAEGALAAALAGGVRCFDTAPYYGYGLSEERIGRYLCGGDVTISTKVGRVIEPGTPPAGEGFAVPPGRCARFDYSRDGILRSFADSLARLKRDRVTILYLHDIGAATHGARHAEVLAQALDEALPAMDELKAQGACDAIGIGVNEEAVALELLPRCDLELIMLAGRYTLLEQGAPDGLMGEAARRGTGIVVAGPFNSGLLAPRGQPGTHHDYAPAANDVRAKASALYALCESFGVDPGAAALQFPLAHPAVVSVVAGMRGADEAWVAVERAAAPIPAAFWHALRAGGLIADWAPIP
jgi:D-threo-aldose 1-dehydrogenase